MGNEDWGDYELEWVVKDEVCNRFGVVVAPEVYTRERVGYQTKLVLYVLPTTVLRFICMGSGL